MDTVSEFYAEAPQALKVKDLPKAATWRLEQNLNPRPSDRKVSTINALPCPTNWLDIDFWLTSFEECKLTCYFTA